jgi:hypothetical protein
MTHPKVNTCRLSRVLIAEVESRIGVFARARVILDSAGQAVRLASLYVSLLDIAYCK